ncbi:MAG: nicotinate-nucleotide--dimethylbenzimidazole phosphoribosyltransferase, partial [Chloroflexi bacterium]|nr:nicotinate-nucleotide--dimethylbenzimidazole phosphoribosyltransferase [Chloroflexota bacterium]
VGRGTGISDQRLLTKIEVIKTALLCHHPPDVNTLEKVGGMEIGAMAGVMIGAAAKRVPVVIDGVISAAAALIAIQLAPACIAYMLASHRSIEPGHSIALDYLGLDPFLDLNLHLGEGSGAALSFPIIDAAMRTLQEMATFDDAGVSDSID